MEILSFEFLDRQIKVYGNVELLMVELKHFQGTYVAEVFYTAIFVKDSNVWKYENWQGTWTKDSPPPPSFVAENESDN